MNEKSCITINCGCCEPGGQNEMKIMELSQISDLVSGSIMRISNTVIMVGATIKEVVSGGVILTLPSEYRPSKAISLFKLTGIEDDPGRIEITINPDGTVLNGSVVTRNYFDLNFMYQV